MVVFCATFAPGFQFNVDFSVKYWLAKGARKDQLLVGMGTYGRGFRLQVSTS
jgi:GH18 family chitinase